MSETKPWWRKIEIMGEVMKINGLKLSYKLN